MQVQCKIDVALVSFPNSRSLRKCINTFHRFIANQESPVSVVFQLGLCNKISKGIFEVSYSKRVPHQEMLGIRNWNRDYKIETRGGGERLTYLDGVNGRSCRSMA